MVDWQNRAGTQVNGVFFFAPTQAAKKSKEWGAHVFQQKLGSSWSSFVKNVESWISDGKVDPSIGHIIKI